MKIISVIVFLCVGLMSCETSGSRRDAHQSSALVDVPGYDQAPPQPSKIVLDELKPLLKPSFYCFGGAGYAGTTTEAELTVRKVLRWKDPVTDLLGVYDRANLAGKAYILAVLLELAPKEYAARKDAYASRADKVVQISGCTRWEDTCAQVIKSIEATHPVKVLQMVKSAP